MRRSVTVRNAVSNAVSNGTPTQPVPTRPDPTYRSTSRLGLLGDGDQESIVQGRIAAALETILTLGGRFASKIEPQPDGCWLWTASCGRGGYGQVWHGGTMARAHRVVYLLVTGSPIPDGLELDHLCRVRHCVNPEHLEPVTRQENQRRRRKGDAKDRQRRYRERQKAARKAARLASGWWVSI